MRRFLTLLIITATAHWLLQAFVMAEMIPTARPDRSGADVGALGEALRPLIVLQWPVVPAFSGRFFDQSPLGALTANSLLWGLAVATLAAGVRHMRKRAWLRGRSGEHNRPIR